MSGSDFDFCEDAPVDSELAELRARNSEVKEKYLKLCYDEWLLETKQKELLDDEHLKPMTFLQELLIGPSEFIDFLKASIFVVGLACLLWNTSFVDKEDYQWKVEQAESITKARIELHMEVEETGRKLKSMSNGILLTPDCSYDAMMANLTKNFAGVWFRVHLDFDGVQEPRVDSDEFIVFTFTGRRDSPFITEMQSENLDIRGLKSESCDGYEVKDLDIKITDWQNIEIRNYYANGEYKNTYTLTAEEDQMVVLRSATKDGKEREDAWGFLRHVRRSDRPEAEF